MAGESSFVPLLSVAVFLSGGTPIKGNPAYWNGTIPWVSAKDMKELRIRDSQDHITRAGLENGSRLAPRGSTLLLTRGMTLLSDVPICAAYGDVAFNQDVKALVPHASVHPSYLTYAVLAAKKKLLDIVELAGHGTGRLPTDRVKSIQIRLPDRGDQIEITNILAKLDDKVELNRQMNETLEGMARAIFQSWFIDLDAAQKRVTNLEMGFVGAEDTLSLPKIEEPGSEPAPVSWDTSTLADFITLNPESWTKDRTPDEIIYVDLGNTKWGEIQSVMQYDRKSAPSRAQRILRSGDTIVGLVRPGNGSFALVSRDGLTGSTGFVVMRPRKRIYREFVYLAATSPVNIERLAQLADGAAYPAVRPEAVVSTPVVRPSDAVLERFSRITSPMLDRIAANQNESHTLVELRDTLLPKLISGELPIRDADRFVGEAI